MNKIALITGATGFLGRHLCARLLEKYYKIVVLVRKTSDISFLDKLTKEKIVICKLDEDFNVIDKIVEEYRPLITFHLAAAFDKGDTNKEIMNLINTNILFGTILLNSLIKYDCKNFISIGTYWQNFKDETYNPFNLYAATKQSFQDIIKFYEEEYGVRCITLKLCDTYGENDDRKKIINLLKQAYIEDKELDMTQGEQYLSLTHIDDIVEGLLLAAEYIMNGEHCGKTFFVANKELIKLKDLVKTIEKIGNKKLKINRGIVPYRERKIMKPYIGEILPGWNIKININKGIKIIFENI